eukprot:19069-Heterococcus_DN1.PRE.4
MIEPLSKSMVSPCTSAAPLECVSPDARSAAATPYQPSLHQGASAPAPAQYRPVTSTPLS